MGRTYRTDLSSTGALHRAGILVALTFDTEHPDRPNHRCGNTDRVLAALVSSEVKATFFVQGRWAASEPDLVRRMLSDGHLVANHSFDHVRFDELNQRQIGEQLRRTHEALTTILCEEPSRWLRLPYHAGITDPRVARAVRRFGYHVVFRNVGPKDWDATITAQQLCAQSLANADERPATVLNLHNWPNVTADSLLTIIDGYRALDAAFVTVDELPIATIDDMLPRPSLRTGGRRPLLRR